MDKMWSESIAYERRYKVYIFPSMDGKMDRVKPIYPHFNFFSGGIYWKIKQKNDINKKA